MTTQASHVFSEMLEGSVETDLPYSYAINVIDYTEAVIGLIFGTSLNIMAAIVFRRPNIKNKSVSIYLFFVAILDLIHSFNKHINNFILYTFAITVNKLNSFMCKIWYFTHFSSRMASALVLTCITIERFISVFFPTKVKLICKPHFPKVFISFIILISMCLNVSFLIFSRLIIYTDDEGKETSRYCVNYDYNGDFDIYHQVILKVMNLLLYSFVPAIIMLLCSVGIIAKLAKYMAKRQEMISGENVGSKVSSTTIMLVVNAIAFSLLTLPESMYHLFPVTSDLIGFEKNKSHDYYLHAFVTTFLSFLVTINHSMNFLLYCISGRTFRNEFLAVCCT